MADVYKMKQGDTRPILRLTLTRNGVAVNTTGWTSAKLLMRLAVDPFTVITVSTVAFVSPQTSGQVDVTPSAPMTATNGLYNSEVETTQGSGLIETFPNDGYFQIEIVDDLG